MLLSKAYDNRIKISMYLYEYCVIYLINVREREREREKEREREREISNLDSMGLFSFLMFIILILTTHNY